MNGKEFIFSLDADLLFNSFYKDFFENDIILDNMAQKDKFDKQKTIRAAFDRLMNELKMIKCTQQEKKYYLIPIIGYDYDIEENLSYEIYPIYDISLLDPDTVKTDIDIDYISKSDEIPKDLLFTTYSMMFLSWNEILSYEMLFLPEDNEAKYRTAAYLLHELSWFGYDFDTYEKNLQEEKEKLEKAIEEAKNPENLKSFPIEDLYKEFNIPEPSEEEKALTKSLTEEVMVKTYNEKVKIYNKYIKGRKL